MTKSVGVMCLALFGGISLAGCTAAPVETGQLQSIQSVFVKPIKETRITALSAMDRDWKPSGIDTSLNDVIAAQGLHLGAEMYSDVSAALQHDGYQLATSSNNADAVVDVSTEIAAFSVDPPIAGGGCEPIAFFDVRVTNTKTGAKILDRTYRLQSGTNTGLTGHVALDAGTAYNVDDCAKLWTNPSITVGAFHFGANALAQAIGKELERH